MTIIARTQYDERKPLPSDLNFEGDRGLTKQSDLKDCDINKLFEKIAKGGALPDMIIREGRYGDFSEVPDYQEALNIVKTAQEQFDALPVNLRNKFENDPVKFLEFVTDEKNMDELEEMGLLKPEVVASRRAAREAAEEVKRQENVKRNEEAEKALIAKIKSAL